MRMLFIASAVALALTGSPVLAGSWSGEIDQGGFVGIATFVVKPDKVAEFEAIMKQVVIDSRAEEGNIDYRLHKVADQPLTYVTYEVFKDQAAADAHNASEHIAKIVPPLLETLDGDITVQALGVVR